MSFAFRALLAIELLAYFLKEVVWANFAVAKLILSKNERLLPAFISVPVQIESEWGIVALANMITLTPGTMTLEVSPDKKLLLVHVIHAEDPEQVVRDIQLGFESRVIAVFDGRRRSSL